MDYDVICYTKENGKNIIFEAGRTSASLLMNPDENRKIINTGSKILGHPITNLYVMIDGKEFTFPEFSQQP